MLKLHIYTLSFLLFAFAINTTAQDIEQVLKAAPLTTSGGLSFSQIGNFSPDTNQTLEPYSYYLSGNINANLFGVINLPFSFAYTNNQISSNTPQPFNRLSLSPSYKWVTAYIGYASMSFSPYTLAGHEFFGGGLELTPGKSFKISAMYGRLKKRVGPDTLGTEPSFQRMGGGLKLDYMNKKIDASVNVFKAKDDINSITYNPTDSTIVKPQDNITAGAMVKLKMIDNFVLTAEYAFSIMNNDISNNDSINNSSDLLIDKQGDLAYYYAFKSNASYTTKIGAIGASYERVSPNYKTLGAYYFNNDFENITANISTSIKQWFNIAMDVGYQRDNLNGQKTNESSRLIYSANANTKLSDRLNLGVSFSNLETYVNIRDVYNQITQTNEFQNLDTLSFTQLNLTVSSNLNYIIQATKQKRQNVNIGFAYQEASQVQADDQSYSGNKIYNSTISYLFSLIPQRLNISTTVNYNRNELPEMTMSITSFNLSIQKAFFEQLKLSLNGSYSSSSNQSETIANIVNIRLTGGYTLQKKHSFNLSLAMVNSNGVQGNKTQYSANLTYNFMFNHEFKRRKEKLEI
ncbi:MAG: hypothetical protein A2041_12645 [Bacteroidetes bacterium GWA2_31_9b]|nr:MAG: hypothetical protein A2041_12645 [Bacteroidetes bacterium GWA2_31_9b]